MPILHEKISTIILAAGVGKRMKSKTPKVLHRVLGKPIVSFVIDLARAVGSSDIVVVVSRSLAEYEGLGGDIRFAIQEKPTGSGDAARKGLELAQKELALILCGDVPLLRNETIHALIEHHLRQAADATILTCSSNDPSGYGRIVRDHDGYIAQIVEQTDATDEQRKINEINAGVYFGRTDLLLSALERITNDNKQGEYYLTDAIRNIAGGNGKVAPYMIEHEHEIIGVNTPAQLLQVRSYVKEMWYSQLMERGVRIEDPATVDIDLAVKVGDGVRIRHHTSIEGATVLQDGETVGPYVRIKDGKRTAMRNV